MTRHEPGTPSITIADIEKHNLPCVTVPVDLPGWFYNPDGKTRTPATVPAGSQLVNFLRDVALAWQGRHGGDPFPCDVLFPDGRFIHMTVSATCVVDAIKSQPAMRWVAETQRWEKEP